MFEASPGLKGGGDVPCVEHDDSVQYRAARIGSGKEVPAFLIMELLAGWPAPANITVRQNKLGLSCV